MGRLVKIRNGNYAHDVTFLLRLKDAVEGDESQDSKWRAKTCAAIQEVALLLVKATMRSSEEDDQTVDDND